MTPREEIERREREWLSPKAALASASRGRATAEPEDDLRTCFQRDRDRVIHSKAFRRLKHKTQVFLAPEGDHYRTRLTHTLEVAQVARTIARALKLNEDLTEAIALAHDLGHPPFGHAGEAALADIMAPIGGFRHDEQSLRVVELLEVRVRSDASTVRGLNLTWEVRDGIATHSKGLDDLETPDRTDVMPATLEGQVARLSDRIAYVHHDTDDSIRAGLITESEVPSEIRSVLGERRGQWLGRLVMDVVECSQKTAAVQMSDPMRAALNTLKDFLSDRVYQGPVNAAEIQKAQRLLRQLFDYYADHPVHISPEYRELMQMGEPALRVIGDFLAGMTDRYAIRMAESLLIPRTWAF